jgi:hypothetical protein
VVPDLDDLAGDTEAEDVHAREAYSPARRRDLTPRTGVCAGGGPASCHEVAVAEHEVDMPLEIWECRAEVSGDPRLPLRPRGWLGRPQVMPNVLVREDLASEFEIAEAPDFLVPSRSVSASFNPTTLFLPEPDGGETTELTRGEPDAAPSWSSDGREIVFVRGHDLNKSSGDMDLFIVDAAGGTPRRLTRTPRSLETAPVWSPDGSRIAFARSSSFSAFTGKAEIFVINRDGSGESLLLEHKLYSETSYGLGWSPDGRTIALETGELDCAVVATVQIATDTYVG